MKMKILEDSRWFSNKMGPFRIILYIYASSLIRHFQDYGSVGEVELRGLMGFRI